MVLPRMYRLLACILLAMIFGPAAAAEWTGIDDHWYVLELDGVKAGWMRITTEDDGSRYRTVSRSEMQFGRASARAGVEISSTFTETHDGVAIECTYRQKMSQQIVESVSRFRDDGVEHRTKQGGRESVRTLDLPEGEWLAPRAAWRYRNERREAGADDIVYRVVDPQNGLQPIAVRMERSDQGEFRIGARDVPVTVWSVTSDMMPMAATERYSSDGYLVHQEITTGLGTLVTRLATRAEAITPGRGGGPELMVQTLIEPDRPIQRIGRTSVVRYRLSVERGDLPEIPAAGAQKVEASGDAGTAVIAVDVSRTSLRAADDDEPAVYLEATAMADAGDELVQALTRRARRRGGEDPAEQAEAMRRLVNKHISRKGLATVFATASETARNRSGDCSEHAVLLCAMLRAGGIPARVATGLVYAEQFAGRRDIFAWHMWTQALIDDRWVDLDATQSRPYHAGHVLISTASLADGASNAQLSSMLGLMGNLEIEVLDVEYRGQ